MIQKLIKLPRELKYQCNTLVTLKLIREIGNIEFAR